MKMLETKEEMERAMPMILDALPQLGGTHDFTDIIQLIMNGSLTLWVAPWSFVLTEIVEYPRLKELNLFLAGGNLEELCAFDEVITDYAKAMGCARIEAHARKGFSRKREMRAIGFYSRQVLIHKDLHHG
jgi:hypothetical protein